MGACVRDLNYRIGNPEKAAGQRPESDQTSACGCGRAAGILRTLCCARGRRRFFRTVVSPEARTTCSGHYHIILRCSSEIRSQPSTERFGQATALSAPWWTIHVSVRRLVDCSSTATRAVDLNSHFSISCASLPDGRTVLAEDDSDLLPIYETKVGCERNEIAFSSGRQCCLKHQSLELRPGLNGPWIPCSGMRSIPSSNSTGRLQAHSRLSFGARIKENFFLK